MWYIGILLISLSPIIYNEVMEQKNQQNMIIQKINSSIFAPTATQTFKGDESIFHERNTRIKYTAGGTGNRTDVCVATFITPAIFFIPHFKVATL